MTVKKRLLLAIAGLAVVVAVAGTLGMRAHPSGAQAGVPAVVNQYAAKFLCGIIPSPASPFSVLAPGTYNTAVNIHNPNNFDVKIQKKAVQSAPEPAQGLPGGRDTHVLKPDASQEVDCAEIDALLNLAPAASPPCPPLGTVGFCKGYLVIEAAQEIVTPTGTRVIPAQIDVTDVITVKEEHFLWKDYTFQIKCLAAPCPPLPCVNPVICTEPQIFYDIPYDLPVPPRPQPLCYSDGGDCPLYNVTAQIVQQVNLACGGCGIPGGQVQFLEGDFATDARDVSLDFEFVTPKRTIYPCWPKGTAVCP